MHKGISCPQEVVEKANFTKHQNLLKKMKWEIIEPFLDVNFSGNNNRAKKFLTLREYKDYLISNITMENLREMGYSKHLLQFCSLFCQNKINITKDKFVEEYKIGKSLDQIGEENNVSRENITYLRQLYQIDRLGAAYQNRKATEIELTQRQKEIIYGSLLGDGKKTSNNSVGFGQGEFQGSYLMWKYHELYSVASKDSFKKYEYLDKRYNNTNISWRFYTHANSDIETIISHFYKSEKKEISKEVLDNITPLGIAVWFMDDGKTDMRYRFNNKLEQNQTPVPVFCSECFSKESCELVKDWFKGKYNISVRLKEKKLKNVIGYRIIINNESVNDFFDLIRPHILPYFLYKIDYKEYCQKRENGIK